MWEGEGIRKLMDIGVSRYAMLDLRPANTRYKEGRKEGWIEKGKTN